MVDVRDIVRQAAGKLVPSAVLEARNRRLLTRSIKRVDEELAGRPTVEVFSEIYRRQLWGRPADGRQFSSGHGSYLDLHVLPYVKAIGDFTAELGWMPSVVDMGCGDFNVGSRIRGSFGTYVACDVAPQVLEENRTRFAGLNVEFRQLDMITDEFPEGDVCIIRQVLQHLSNVDIVQILEKLHKYKILVLTEPLPITDFTPNLDQPTGVSSRLARGIPSGVVVTEPPFSLQVASSKVLCTTYDDFSNARVVTTAYWLS